MAPFAVGVHGRGPGAVLGRRRRRSIARSRRRGALRVLVFAGALALCEWLRGHVLTGFPWDLPGETWRAGSAPSQAGVGASAPMASPGSRWRSPPRPGWAGAGAARGSRLARRCVGLAALYGFGAWRLATRRPAARPTRRWSASSRPTRRSAASYDAAAFADVADRNLDAHPRAGRAGARHRDLVGGRPAGARRGLPRARNLDAPTPSPRRCRPGQTLITGGYRVRPAPPGAYAPDGIVYFNSLLRAAARPGRAGGHRALRQAPAGAVRRVPAARPPGRRRWASSSWSTSARASRPARRRGRSRRPACRPCSR